MSTVDQILTKPESAPTPLPVLVRQRDHQLALSLLGRFIRSNKEEYPCRLSEISLASAAVLAPVIPAVGEHIIAFVEQIGGLEGNVTRVFEGGFDLHVFASEVQREKLADKIMRLSIAA